MSLKIKTRTGSTVKPLVKMALENKLYVETWSLKDEYEWILAKNPDRLTHVSIGLAFVDDGEHVDKPVAVVLLTSYGQAMAYCKPSFRRKGITSKIISRMRDKLEGAVVDEGIIGSDKFWMKNNLTNFIE